ASLQASIDTNLNRAARGMTISGTGQLTKARLQMSQAAKPVEVVNADLRFTGDSLRIDNLAAQSGASQLTGWLQIKDFDHPLASFDLKSNQLNLSEARQMLASGPKAQAKTSGSSSIRADGQIAIGKLLLDTLTVTDLQSKVTMANRVLTLDPMSLKMYGGLYQGSVTIDLSAGGAEAPSEIALRGNFNGLDINQFLSASGQKSSIYGRANGSI